jgi:hypothetical protein
MSNKHATFPVMRGRPTAKPLTTGPLFGAAKVQKDSRFVVLTNRNLSDAGKALHTQRADSLGNHDGAQAYMTVLSGKATSAR